MKKIIIFCIFFILLLFPTKSFAYQQVNFTNVGAKNFTDIIYTNLVNEFHQNENDPILGNLHIGTVNCTSYNDYGSTWETVALLRGTNVFCRIIYDVNTNGIVSSVKLVILQYESYARLGACIMSAMFQYMRIDNFPAQLNDNLMWSSYHQCYFKVTRSIVIGQPIVIMHFQAFI